MKSLNTEIESEKRLSKRELEIAAAQKEDQEILNFLKCFTTQEIIELFSRLNETPAIGLDLAQELGYASENLKYFLTHRHELITHKPGVGASQVASQIELLNRGLSNSSLTIPINLNKGIIPSLGCLVEGMEYSENFIEKNFLPYEELVETYARIISANGKDMQNFLRLIKRNGKMIHKTKAKMGLAEYIPQTGRMRVRYIPATKERIKFASDVLKVRRVQSPKTLEEMILLIKDFKSEYAKDIILIVDIPNDKDAQKHVDYYTNPELLTLLSKHKVFIKIFAPDQVKIKNAELFVNHNFFEWTDELIVKMINEKFRSMGSWYKISMLQSEKFDLVGNILKFANKNPRLALMVTQAVLNEAVKDDGVMYAIPKNWNTMCDNWQYGNPKPKKIKI